MKQYTVVSNDPNDTYQYGIFKTRAIAAIMVRGLQAEWKGQSFKVIEL